MKERKALTMKGRMRLIVIVLLLVVCCLDLKVVLGERNEEEDWNDQDLKEEDEEDEVKEKRNLQENLSILNHPTNLNVGVYYYPWHAHDFHRDGGYLRELMGHTPHLGEYDDRNADVIRQHLRWSRQANVGLWVSSWWGPFRREDNTIRNQILPLLEKEKSPLQITLHYETIGRTRPRSTGIVTTKEILDDINHIAKYYFDHPNYFKINNRPVLVVYLTRFLFQRGILEETLLLMRTVASKAGHNIYIVGDHAFGIAPTDEMRAFDYLDAITTYDVYGQLGTGYVGQTRLEAYFKQQEAWKSIAKRQNCAYIPGVTPGFNDRGVRIDVDHAPLSRKLEKNMPFGSLFQNMLELAMRQVDGDALNFIFVNSFNEWHEDTQIEPANGTLSTMPLDYTQGFEYEGYQDLYLNILRRLTCPFCNAFTPSPLTTTTPRPTPRPTPKRTPSPIAAPMTTPIPTLSPTPQPTTKSIGINIPITVSADPCDDDPNQTFPTPNSGPQRCVWLASRQFARELLCKPTLPAFSICAETCGKCVDDCEDDPRGTFLFKNVQRDCLWLSLRPNVQQQVCRRGASLAWIMCKETCNNCGPDIPLIAIPPIITDPLLPSTGNFGSGGIFINPLPVPQQQPPTIPQILISVPLSPLTDPCDDDFNLQFPTPSDGLQSCVWLSSRTAQQAQLCVPSHPAYHICEETCGKCRDECEDNPDGRFEFNNVMRPCSWLYLRQHVQIQVCIPSNAAWNVCRETCNNCIS